MLASRCERDRDSLTLHHDNEVEALLTRDACDVIEQERDDVTVRSQWCRLRVLQIAGGYSASDVTVLDAGDLRAGVGVEGDGGGRRRLTRDALRVAEVDESQEHLHAWRRAKPHHAGAAVVMR